METALREIAGNAGWAAALALLAAVCGRVFRRRPALVHGLWVLVLLKLVTPSMLHLPAGRVEGPTTAEAAEAAAPRLSVEAMTIDDRPEPRVIPTTGPASAPANPPRRVGSGSWPWRTASVVLWLGGSVAWWSVVGLQISRFRRLLREARPAPEALRDRVERLAKRLGLRRGPSVWLIPAGVPPMLWAPVGAPRLVLPEGLWDRLNEPQRDTVLAHELAHLRRRDHWVRRLEAVVLGLYWWNPVAWWARRRIEDVEEQCCDAWVSWALPEAVESYAEALVATAAFLSGPRPIRPAGATGVGQVTSLRRRLSMILRDPATGTSARLAPRGVLIVGCLALLLLPGWLPGRPQEGTDPPGAGPSDKPGEAASPVEPGPGETTTTPIVTVSLPLVREVGDFADFNGRVEKPQMVAIRAGASGIVTKVHAVAGKAVKRGDLLFVIDPRRSKVELEKAEAEVDRAESQLRRRSVALQNAEKLHTTKAISQSEVDQVRADRDESLAVVRSAQATRELARLNLESTQVSAPISGKIGGLEVLAGSAVAANTVLATITPAGPAHVGFDVDERTFLRMGRARGVDKANSALEPGLPVLIGLADDEDYPRRGQVDSVDTEFQPGHGTLHCRAVVVDSDRLLLPGMLTRVRLLTGRPSRTLLVAEGAVLTGQGQKFVLVVGDRGVVDRRPVTIGARHDGLRVVKEGLKEKEWVVVGGMGQAMPGTTVAPARVPMPTGEGQGESIPPSPSGKG